MAKLARLAALLVLGLAASPVWAEAWHTVRPGQTLSQIARRYRMSQRAIARANGLSRRATLSVGMRLRIPDGDDPVADIGRRRPGSISFIRVNNGEEARIQLVRTDGRINPTGARRFRRLLRTLQTDATREISPRLLRLVQKVGDRWPTSRVFVISGYREHSRPGGSRHSRHELGRAVDMRVDGVPNTVLRDFCRTFAKVGVGYYPNSTFVHLDVRERTAYWVDYSRPGEPPQYRQVAARTDDDDETAGDQPEEIGAADGDADSVGHPAAGSPQATVPGAAVNEPEPDHIEPEHDAEADGMPPAATRPPPRTRGGRGTSAHHPHPATSP